MKNNDDEKLEQAICSHLAKELDPFAGRVKAAFEEHIAVEAARRKTRWMVWAAIPLAAAAAVVVAALLPRLFVQMDSQDALPQKTASVAPAAIPVYDHVLLTRQVDAGPSVLNDVPVRVLREQNLSHVRWVDAEDRSVITVTRPEEHVRYVVLSAY